MTEAECKIQLNGIGSETFQVLSGKSTMDFMQIQQRVGEVRRRAHRGGHNPNQKTSSGM